jgi:Tfp pilus assembly protein PilV
MIHTNFFRRRPPPRAQLGLDRTTHGELTPRAGAPRNGAARASVTAAVRRGGARRGDLGAEDGIGLIEVMVSALMMGFIVIATFNGFNAVNHTTANVRASDQAAVLAAQSLEEMRSDSATTLDTLQSVPHIYTQTLGGETYTITQSDRWVIDSNQNASCSAIGKEHSSQAGNYLRISTSVIWPQLKVAKRPALEQSSIITPPDGSGLEVDVVNGRIPQQAVPGATVKAGEAEATTSEAGCVIFGGIPETRINVEVFKLGDVTPTGAVNKVLPEVLIAPNVTTHEEAVLNQGASITAEFTHEGKAVKGDTFVAYNPKINLAPDFEVGSTAFGEPVKATGEYEALTGTYKATATTPVSSTYYPTGDLFPYESAWFAYAGDCPANNPHTSDPAQFSESAVPTVMTEPGQEGKVSIPTSEVKLALYTGTAASHEALEPKPQAVKITNTECGSSPKPNNAAHYKTEHTQSTTSEGKLEVPYQPFGKSFTLCVYDSEKKKTYSTQYADETIEGPKIGIYLKEAAKYADGNGHTVEVKTNQNSNTC